jgi:hypothetical protein
MADDEFGAKVVVGKNQNENPTEAFQYDGTAPCAQRMKYWIRDFGGRATDDNFNLMVETSTGLRAVQGTDWVVRVGPRRFQVFPQVVFIDLFMEQ